MFERFTDRARKVMALANQEAQRFNHEYIGTEHILLGLVKEGSGVGAAVLKNLDVDIKKLRLEVEKVVKSGPDKVTMGKLPQTPRAKKVIEYAIEEARSLNHNYVGTEHILLGILRESEGIAAQVLMSCGLKLENVRQEVLNLLGVGDEREISGQKRTISNTRKRGIEYLCKILGHKPSEPIAVSKFFKAEESWTGKAAWWFDLPIKKIKKHKSGIYYLLGKAKKGGFVVLRVPCKFLADNLKKFETSYQDKVRLNITAEGSTQFVDERGKGRVSFSRFELTGYQEDKQIWEVVQWRDFGKELSETEVRDFLLKYSTNMPFEQRYSLKGLDSVKVWVKVEGAQPSRYGSREEEEALQTTIELRLRQHGIKVDPVGPILHIIVDGAYNSESGWAAIAVRVELQESAVLLFRPKTNALVVTWQQTDVIVAKYDKFRGVKENVYDLVGKFINDYLAANPKSKRGEQKDRIYGIDSIPNSKMIWIKCNNPDCKAAYQMGKRDYFKYIEEHAKPLSPSAPALVCKKCGKESIYRAEKCTNSTCGKVFIRGATRGVVPKDFLDRCPECGHSEIEEIRSKRSRGSK